MSIPKPGRLKRNIGPLCTAALLLAPAVAVAAPADAPDPNALLKRMSDYLAAQHDIGFSFGSDIEVVTDAQQKLAFVSSGTAVFSKPNKFSVHRQGGYTDVSLVSDGNEVTVSGHRANVFAKAPMPAQMGDFVHQLAELGVDSPAADLLLPDAYKQLTDGRVTGAVIGTGIVDGHECEHLAYRTPDVDWQLWIRTGDQPLPCLYIITSKHVAQAPQYSVRFSNWTVGQEPAADAFQYLAG